MASSLSPLLPSAEVRAAGRVTLLGGAPREVEAELVFTESAGWFHLALRLAADAETTHASGPVRVLAETEASTTYVADLPAGDRFVLRVEADAVAVHRDRPTPDGRRAALRGRLLRA